MKRKKVADNMKELDTERKVFNLTDENRVILSAYAEKQFQYLCYCLTKSKLFVPIGLELNSTTVKFETNKTFALKDFTFGYFNSVTNSIHINIEDSFFLGKYYTPENINKNIRTFINDMKSSFDFTAKLLFILFHEINHKFFDHTNRQGVGRDATLWNIAADYEIHSMYYVYRQVFDPAENDNGMMNSYMKIIDEFLFSGDTFCFSMDYLENIAEEIYEMIANSAVSKKSQMKFNLDCNGNIQNNSADSQGENDSDNDNNQNSENYGTVEVTETEYTLPNGKKYKTVSVKFNDKNIQDDAIQKAKAQEAQNTALNKALSELSLNQTVKEKGNLSKECMKFLKKMFHIKIDWEKILRNSLQNVLEKTDYFGWNSVRTSTFLLQNMPYLPDVVEDDTKYGTLIIARDESGSMSDNDLRKAVAIIMEAKAHYKDIILIKHDTKINQITKFEEITADITEEICTRASCGGTSHKEVFEYLRDYKESDLNGPISCFIGISDLESDIETYQQIVPSKIPMLWLVPNNMDDNQPNINGKIIYIE